jgi:hypothetical protein
MAQPGREGAGVAMHQLWCEALWRFVRAPKLTEQRERQVNVIYAIMDYIDAIDSVDELNAHYQSSAELCQRIALALYPNDGQLQDLHRTQDVAYALRYVELMSGHELDPGDALPCWIGEWAVF